MRRETVAEIPQPVLDEIKHRIDIQALVSEHLSLKRSGRGFVGLCGLKTK